MCRGLLEDLEDPVLILPGFTSGQVQDLLHVIYTGKLDDLQGELDTNQGELDTEKGNLDANQGNLSELLGRNFILNQHMLLFIGIQKSRMYILGSIFY